MKEGINSNLVGLREPQREEGLSGPEGIQFDQDEMEWGTMESE